MAHEDFNSEEVIYRVSMDDSLKDILLEITGVFDNNYLFAYRNWDKGVVCRGPNVSRHWVDVSFRWPAEEKPDMDGAARLSKLNIICTQEEGVMEIKPEPEIRPEPEQMREDVPDTVKMPVFYVHMEIPKDFIADIKEPMSDGLIGNDEEKEIGDEATETEDEELPPPETEEELPDGA